MNSTAAQRNNVTEHADGLLTMVRYFDAPRELVFRMWTEAEHFMRWFGPADGSVPHCTIKPNPARVGSEMHFCVAVPPGEGEFAGETVWGKWIFRELAAPERIAFDDYFSDEQGNIVERPGFANETNIRVHFEEHGGGTKMTVLHDLEIDHGEVDGWAVGFDRMSGYLHSIQDESRQGEVK